MTPKAGLSCRETLAADAPELLRLAGLHLEFLGKPVLDGLDLEVASGEIHGLLGANEAGIDARIVVAAGAQLALPLHLCFGLYQQLGVQNVRLDLTLEPASQATVLAHCLFATPLVARHAMQGEIRLMEGATLRHEEGHYHGTSGEIQVIPHARVSLAKGARYLADFSLLQGRVGQLDIDVDSRQLETLMARGLAPDEAVDVIVRGMLA